jgi:transcriptional regulator with XRE-family HTH domain
MADHLGIRIATARLHKELSQEQLAQVVGIHRNTLASMEAGDPTGGGQFLVVKRIALVLGVSLEYLAGFTDDPTPPQRRPGTHNGRPQGHAP